MASRSTGAVDCCALEGLGKLKKIKAKIEAA
jgi:hypothetical protein